MWPKVIPAVLAATKTTFLSRLKIATRLSRQIHIDLMDGRFVSSRSVGPNLIRGHHFTQPLECHLMVLDPWRWYEAMAGLPLRKLIVHVELGRRLLPFIALVRLQRVKIDLAVNPRTPIAAIRPWVKMIDGLHLMSVEPGRYGSRFLPRAINRVKSCRRQFPDLPIAVDGGVKLENIRSLAAAGADRLIVGSAIMKSSRPIETYRQLTTALKSGNVIE